VSGAGRRKTLLDVAESKDNGIVRMAGQLIASTTTSKVAVILFGISAWWPPEMMRL